MKATFAILLYILTMCEANDYNCLNCEDFNRQNAIKCTLNYEQCGDCIPGNIPDESDTRICYALEIITSSPTSVGGVEGRSIELPCEFNSKVECVWERNGQHVDIGESHRYKFKTKGVTEVTPAEDCTLLIEDLHAIDVGKWQCGSRATSSTISVKSALISITLIKEERSTPKVTESPTTKQPRSEVISIFINDVIVDGREISISAIEQIGSEIECKTNNKMKKLRWTIDGNLIKQKSSANWIKLNDEDISGYFHGLNWSSATVHCDAAEAEVSHSFIILLNQGSVITTVPSTDSNNTVTLLIAILLVVLVAVVLAIVIPFCAIRNKIKLKQVFRREQTEEASETDGQRKRQSIGSPEAIEMAPLDEQNIGTCTNGSDGLMEHRLDIAPSMDA